MKFIIDNQQQEQPHPLKPPSRDKRPKPRGGSVLLVVCHAVNIPLLFSNGINDKNLLQMAKDRCSNNAYTNKTFETESLPSFGPW